MLGADYVLVHVLPDFKNKICSRFANRNNDAFGPTKFQLWERCLQSKALTKWGIAKAGYPTNAEKTLADFTEAIQFYLEIVAGVKYLGNFIISILRTKKKPALVLIEDYLAWRNKIKRHIGGPYLFHNLALPTLHEKAEQIYDHQPKQHRAKYAETNEEVETHEAFLKTFEGCHTANVDIGEYEKVVNGVKAAIENRVCK